MEPGRECCYREETKSIRPIMAKPANAIETSTATIERVFIRVPSFVVLLPVYSNAHARILSKFAERRYKVGMRPFSLYALCGVSRL